MCNNWMIPSILCVISALPTLAAPPSQNDPDAAFRIKATPRADRLSRPGKAGPTEAQAVSAVSETCLQIGAFNDVFFGTNVFRGNAYRILEQGVVLREIKMELQFSGCVDLYFSIHRAMVNDPDRIFQRFGNDIPPVPVCGDGTPQFYSSGPLQDPNGGTGLPLDSGFDYIIGVSWTQTDGLNRSVRYGRNQVVQPKPFLHGKVMGLVAINAVAPPLLADLINPTVFTDFGVYSMQLCFDPVVGACCAKAFESNAISGCDLIFESACSDPGAFFRGERTTCFAGLCEFGACCMPCGTCSPDYTLEACEAAGGAWAGRNVACGPPGLCEPVTGACCQPNGTCTELCETECNLIPGSTYRGDGTDCFPNFCAGACCVSSTGCVDLPESVCNGIGGFGAYRGDGTTCLDLPPGLECGGACCTTLVGPNTTDCFVAGTRAQCTDSPFFNNTIYLGDAIPCGFTQNNLCNNPTTIESGACCLPNGTCQFGSRDFCDRASGIFSAGSACAGLTCNTLCCIGPNNDQCRVAPDAPNAQACTDAGGLPTIAVQTTCLPNPCGEPLGGCCFADRSCMDSVTRLTCEDAGGRFLEGATDCTLDCPADLGVCCRPGGACSDNDTAMECNSFGGNHNVGATCGTLATPCIQPGACCVATGECLIRRESECLALGQFLGEGTTCGTGSCPTGACCTPLDQNGQACGQNEGVCNNVTDAGCMVAGGTFAGNGTRCDDADVCCGDVPGACCLDDRTGGFTCANLIPQDCFDQGGLFQGGGTTCDADICTTGACCIPAGPDPATCRNDVFPLDCRNQLGGVLLPGVTCLSQPCDLRGACCELQPDGTPTCTPDLRPDECVSDGATHHPGVSCVPLPCQPRGACCSGGSCSITLADACVGPNDVYLGDSTTCAGADCTPGSCCRTDGTCSDVSVRSACTDPGATFISGGDCTTCQARGACCVFGFCEITTQQSCVSAGGQYGGDGSLCDAADLCQVGACCLSDNSCGQRLRLLCRPDGVFVGPGTTCLDDVSDCTRGSCCDRDGTCVDDTIVDLCPSSSATFAPGDTCANQRCTARGACCVNNTCQVLTQSACRNIQGTYQGDVTFCTVTQCGNLTIVATDPFTLNCSIDPKQPSQPGGADATGVRIIPLRLNGNLVEPVPADFELTLFPGSATPPNIVQVIPLANRAQVSLDRSIPPGQWTCINVVGKPERACLGFLPGDVDLNRTTNLADMTALFDCLTAPLPCSLDVCDIDRSGGCSVPDILRVIDLLNGAGAFSAWLDVRLPICPSTLP